MEISRRRTLHIVSIFDTLAVRQEDLSDQLDHLNFSAFQRLVVNLLFLKKLSLLRPVVQSDKGNT